VLVDSERVANEVFARALDEVCGLRFSLEQMFDTFVGHSKAQCLEKIEAMTGSAPPAECSCSTSVAVNTLENRCGASPAATAFSMIWFSSVLKSQAPISLVDTRWLIVG